MADAAILIPVHNDERGLRRTLSLLPSEEPLDVVIVDDGSRVPIVARSSTHRLHLRRLPENRGIESALNEGIAFIRRMGCEFVCRLDAGDVALPTRFTKQLQFLRENPAYRAIGSHVRHVDMEGQLIEDERFPQSHAEILAGMRRRNMMAHPAVTFRLTDLADPVYSDVYPAAEDYELFWRLARQAPVCNLDEVLTLKEDNPRGISNSRCRIQALSALRLKLRFFDFRDRSSYGALSRDLRRILIPDAAWRLLKKRWSRQAPAVFAGTNRGASGFSAESVC